MFPDSIKINVLLHDLYFSKVIAIEIVKCFERSKAIHNYTIA